MRRFLCCALLALLGVSLAAGPRASVQAQGVTFTARRGALAAQTGRRELWRVTGVFGQAQELELLVTGGRTLLVLSDRGEGRGATVSAYALGSGKRLWQTTIVDEAATQLDLRGAAQGTALVSAIWGQPKIPRVIALSTRDGRVQHKQPGELLGIGPNYALLLDYGLVLEPPTGAWLPLVRLDLRQGKRTYIGLTIPERRGCGPVRSRTGKSDLRFGLQYVTALRRDNCGPFTARVDWHGPAGQRPVIRSGP